MHNSVKFTRTGVEVGCEVWRQQHPAGKTQHLQHTHTYAVYLLQMAQSQQDFHQVFDAPIAWYESCSNAAMHDVNVRQGTAL
jgi:acyl-CoA hydrolase